MMKRKMVDLTKDDEHGIDYEMFKEAIERAFYIRRSKITIYRSDGSVRKNYTT